LFYLMLISNEDRLRNGFNIGFIIHYFSFGNFSLIFYILQETSR
jgi:hypothetical protein